ncbi:MAG: T9SS type A sorting domain-containing protein [Bacteroidia bacterium]|nr:T9SS type A sorting domain-containing protein [Bacteroidia bacterium]
MAENVSYPSGVFSSGDDRSLFFNGVDYSIVPSQAFASLDSFVTVSFWQYGNPAFQPQDQSNLEGYDSLNRRVINIHLPWSNSNVYWDCGNSGSSSYDRLNAAATLGSFAGKWNYWTFTKNVATGRMRIYLNGSQWTTATGKIKRMYGITKFKFGSAANGSINYDGNMDEFAVWNAELDSNTIKAYMYKDLDASHPYNSNLLLYYQCNDNSFSTTTDASSNGNDGTLLGPPASPQVGGENLFRNLQSTTERPNIIFEQGVYNSHLDSTFTVDSVANEPFQIVQYNDFNNPTIPTDTLLVWATYYNQYQYDLAGNAIDSMLVNPDSMLYLVHTPYYNVFERIVRYEIGRYITPYGINLNLGTGFTWTFDVSDYATLLHDTVYLQAGNWQELLDVQFKMIRGIPPRDPIKVENVFVGNYGLNNFNTAVLPKTIYVDSAAANTRYKMRTTGHGQGGAENCAEFCIKHNYLLVDGIQRWDTIVWRNNCSLNPLYPQGGTWIYNRANWCPGSDVPTFDFELTPYATPGDSVTLDYKIQPTTSGGNYVVETQLVSYQAPNFTLDAGVWDIKAPSKADIYKRLNPICTRPTVTIRNGGTTTLTSLTITYGIEGGPQSVFNWTGSLPFMKTEDVTMPPFAWSSGNKFIVTVSNPNGGTDEYVNNNTMKGDFGVPPEYDADLIFHLRTDLHYDQYNGYHQGSYTVKDENGNIVFQRTNSSLLPNTTYRDTVHLASGCYEFRFTDDVAGITNPFDNDYNYGDGMTNWPDQTNNPIGQMMIKRMNNTNLKIFGMDFGRELFQHFTVGYYLTVPQQASEETIDLYPNPSEGIFNLDMAFAKLQDVSVLVTDMMGRKVYSENMKNVFAEILPLDLSREPNGIYFVVVQSKDKRLVRKLVKHN